MSYYNIPNYDDETKPETKFNPYSNNGGSVVAIAGEDFAIIGADTRLSFGHSIISRNQSRLLKLTDQSVLGTSGCWADCVTLSRMLELRVCMYRSEHYKTMPTSALAQMLSVTLYYKRFFPYFVMNTLAGIDENGKGCVFDYDPVGHYERSTFRASGSAGPLLQPFLDNQIGLLNMQNVNAKSMSKERAISLLKDAFTSAAERNICTGGDIQILTMAAGGIQEEIFSLRKD